MSGAETLARCWAISRADGLALGFTDHDAALAFEGIAFRPGSGLTARAIVQGVGLSTDNTEAEGALTDDAITEADLLAGRWDRAEIRMWEVDWTDSAARKLLFRGHLGEVARQGGAFRAELRGLSEPLNASQGRVYHPRCSARLGDAACRVPLATVSVDVAIAAVTEAVTLDLALPLERPEGWFDRGTLRVLTGVAAGLEGRIKDDLLLPFDGGRRLVLWEAVGAPLAPGDRVRIAAGCDKRPETCRGKFNNFINFRGFPHLPSEDWLLAPQAGGRRHG